MKIHLVGGSDDAPLRVIFLHGLGGSWQGTWKSRIGDTAWPQWLAERDPQKAIWCVDYWASPTRWRGHSMPIRDRATSLLGAFVDALGFDDKPFVMVGHSLGGLLIKQMIRHSVTMGDQYQHFAEKLAGVVFFSTPHTGSGIASLARYVRSLRTTPLVEELISDQAYLRELDDWYRNHASRAAIPTISFYEKQKTKGLRVVDDSSGDPHLPRSTAIPVDADHLSICKFEDRSDLVYLQVERFVQTRLNEALNLPAHRTRLSAPQQAGRQGEFNPWKPVDQALQASTCQSWPRDFADVALLALLSEQLPSGGWTRSLARWMTRYASASGTAEPDRPPMRVHGGIDVTCAALNQIVSIGHSGSTDLRDALQRPLLNGLTFLRTRTPASGAVGATTPTRTDPVEVRIRHTAVGLRAMSIFGLRLRE